MFKKSLLFLLLMTLLAPWAVAQKSLPYSYGFEDNNLATDGWTSTSGAINTAAAKTGTYGYRFSYSVSSDVFLMSPILTGGTYGVNVSFYYKAYSGSYLDHFYVGYTTDETVTDPSAFTYGAMVTSSTSWQLYEDALPAGTVRVAIKYDADNYDDGYYLYLDDFSFTAASSCVAPTNALATYTSGTTATVTWEGSAPSYKIDVNGTITSGVSSPYVLNVAPATTYTVKVQADCGSEQSAWVTAGTFTTDCPTSFSIPYTYGFEDESGINCWTIEADNDGFTGVQNNTWAATNLGGSYARTGEGFFFFLYTETPPHYLISPLLSGISNGLHVEFWYRQYANGVETFQVGYSTTDNDPSSFTWDAEVTASTTYQRYSANYPAGTKYVAVKLTSDDQYYLFLDDFVFEESASCLEPTAVTVTNATTDGATVNWTVGSTETAWDIFVTDDATITPDDETTPTIANTTTKPYPLTGLTSATTYYVYVRAICEKPSAWSSPAIFNTECEGMTLPYSYDFQDDELPICWSSINTNTSYLAIGNMAPSSSSTNRVLYFYRGSSTGTLVAVLPEVDSHYSLSDYQITFDACYANGSGGSMTAGKLGIGIMDDPTDFTTFELIEEVDITDGFSTYGSHTVMFNNYTGHGQYIAIQDIHTQSGYVLVDNIEVTELPACIAPTALGAAPSTTSAVLNWTANSGETSWNIYYKKTSDTDYTELKKVTDNPYTLTPLEANTNYEYYVVANCSSTETSEPSAVYSFKTQCGAVTTFPWDEDFEGMTASTVPECWDNSASTAQEITSNPQYIWGVYEYSSNKMIRMYNYFVHTGTALINSPSIDLPSTGVYQLTFDYAHNASCGAFKVNISDDNGTTWVEKGSYTKGSGSSASDPGTFTSVDPILLGDYAGQTIMIQFFANADYGNGAIFVDNVLINEAPNCIAPNGLGATPSTTSAELSWTANSGEASWNIYYKKTSETDYTELKKVTDNPYTLPGLDPATDYEFYVKANCTATETSDPSSVYYFSTECVAVSTFPWIENFNSLTDNYSIPTCWDNSETTATSASYLWGYNTSTSGNGATSGTSHDGSNCVRFNSYSPSSGVYDCLKTPVISLPSTPDMQLSFWYKNPAGGDFSVYISTDGGATYGTALATGLTGVTAWTEHNPINLSAYAGQDVVIVFKATSNCGYNDAYIYLDDVTIKEVPSCFPPMALECTDYTATTATFAWTANGANQPSWQLYISETNVAPADNIDLSLVIEANTNPFTVTSGLVAEHTYYAWVRGNCTASSEGYSEWAGGIAFTPSQYKNFTYQETASSSTGYVPVYGSYASNATNKGQILIPATYFPEEMADATVRRLTFYTTNSYPTADWGDAKFDVLVAEVAETSFATAAFFDWTEMTTVYSGSLSVSGNQMVIDLDTPFSYTGGNLVIGFNLTATGTNGYVQWVATYGSTYLATYQYGTSSVYRTYYQPMTTFNYLPNPTPRPINPHPTEELSTEATVAWTAPNSTEVTGYQYQYKLATSTEWPTYYYDEIGLSATMTELTPEKIYDFRVRAVYPGPAYSQYAETQFTTTASCAIPDGLAAANLTMNTADLTWNASTEVLAYTVEYRTAASMHALFEEGFEDATEFNNWQAFGVVTTNTDSRFGRVTDAKRTDSYGFSFSSWTSATDYNQYLISPELTVTGNKLEFYYRSSSTNSSGEMFKVGYSSTGNDVADFTWGSTFTTKSTTWSQFSDDIPAGTKYIAINYCVTSSQYRLYIDDLVIGNTVSAGAWTTATTAAPNTGVYTITLPDAGTKYDVRVYANCAIDPETDNTLTTFTTLADHNIVFPDTGVWNSTNFEPAVDPTVADNVIIRANVTITDGNNAYANNVTLENGAIITIENGATLTIKGTVTGGGSDKIIIEDGGQLIHNNSVYATVKKNITAPAVWKGTSDSDGWYLIATPLYSTTISSVFTGVIDLFQYNEPAAYWYSYNNGDHTFTSMTRGAGYLHASQNTQTVSYAGSMIGTESAETKSLSYTSTLGDDVRGFNLIGNPFTRNLVLGDMTIGSTPVSTVYVVTDADRTKLTAYTTDEYAIAPGEGFFVQSTATSQTLTMNPAAKDEFEFRYIKIVAGNENGFDNAYVQIGNGNTLRKMNIANKMEVYVINNDEDYAAARVDELQGKIPVNFKAVEDGDYTITVNANNLDVNMMLLLDNFSGEFIDLLENPSYTFKATTDDSEARFTLVFDCNNNTGIDENYTGNIFAYQYDDEIIVNGEGTLFVYDMMGRFVGSYEVNGSKRISASQFSNAVYIFRMVGETIQTQKIVVR